MKAGERQRKRKPRSFHWLLSAQSDTTIVLTVIFLIVHFILDSRKIVKNINEIGSHFGSVCVTSQMASGISFKFFSCPQFCSLVLKIIDQWYFVDKCNFYKFSGNKKIRRSDCQGPYSSMSSITRSWAELFPSGIGFLLWLNSALFPHDNFMAPVGL